MKLLIEPPEPDETISSVLDRAATLYGTTRSELVWELARKGGRGKRDRISAEMDVDVNPHPYLVRGLSRALECSCDLIMDLRISNTKWLLSPGYRDLYCEKCFDEDISRTGSVYLRHDWAFAFITHCRRHKMPLSLLDGWSKYDISSGRQLPILQRLKRKKPHARVLYGNRSSSWRFIPTHDVHTELYIEMWRRLCRFESRMLQLYLSNPNSFDKETTSYRDLVTLFSGNWRDERQTPVMFFLYPIEALIVPQIFNFPRALKSPDYDADKVWDDFVQRVDPMWRRAAIWLLAQCYCDEDPIDQNPPYEERIRNTRWVFTINRAKWFEACLDQLPDHGRQLARSYAPHWEKTLREIAERLFATTPHLDIEILNQHRTKKHLDELRLLRVAIESADRKINAFRA